MHQPVGDGLIQSRRRLPTGRADFSQLRQPREFVFNALQLAPVRNHLRRGCVETEAAFALVFRQLGDPRLMPDLVECQSVYVFEARDRTVEIERTLLDCNYLD